MFFSIVETKRREAAIAHVAGILAGCVRAVGLPVAKEIRISCDWQIFVTENMQLSLLRGGWEDFSQYFSVVEDLDEVCLRRSPLMHPNAATDPNLVRAARILCFAMGWAGFPENPSAKHRLIEVLPSHAPTARIPELLEGAEWCDPYALRLVDLIALRLTLEGEVEI